MIVLGGAIENEVMNSRGGIEFNAAADRYTEALRLAIAHPEAKILVSGGDGSFSGRYEGEAVAAERFFSSYGVPTDRIIKENESRNTWENVQKTKALLEKQGLNDCLLITSAFHMPRATALFEKAGLAVKPGRWTTGRAARFHPDWISPSHHSTRRTHRPPFGNGWA